MPGSICQHGNLEWVDLLRFNVFAVANVARGLCHLILFGLVCFEMVDMLIMPLINPELYMKAFSPGLSFLF